MFFSGSNKNTKRFFSTDNNTKSTESQQQPNGFWSKHRISSDTRLKVRDELTFSGVFSGKQADLFEAALARSPKFHLKCIFYSVIVLASLQEFVMWQLEGKSTIKMLLRRKETMRKLNELMELEKKPSHT
jgi:hypothetical protein